MRMEEFVFSLNGRIDPYYLNRNYTRYFLDKAGDKPVRIKVSSYGGDVSEAVAISNLLAEHGNVTIEFIGFNASCATWLVFGAKTIEAHEDCMFLAHKSSIGVDIYGALNADDLANKIKELENSKKSAEAIDLMIASKYVDKTGKALKDIINLMQESRWMNASEAKQWGFVDTIIPGINKSIKLTNEMVMNFEALGIPVPELHNDTDEDGIVNRILNGVRSIVGPKKNQNNTESIMRKEFVAVNELLKCEGFAENQGKVTLTVEQLQAINQAIDQARTDKEKANNDLTDEKKKLTDAITELDNLSDDIKGVEGVDKKIGVIKNLLEKVPGVKIISPTASNDGKRDFSDVAHDPINSFAEE